MGKKKKKVTVGYWYAWDLLMGLCRGPVDEIVEIRVDDKQVWAGRPGEANISKRVYTSKRNLFGGDGIGGEGGIDGYIEIAMGEPDQVPTQSVLNLVKGIVPGFRGVVTMFYSGWVSAFNAYPKKWSTRVRRATKGWFEGVAWYPEKARIILRNDNASVTVNLNDGAAGMFGQIGAMPQYTVDVPAITENLKQIHAMNPAHILVESATDPDWGADIDHDIIDLDLYKSIADTLAEEGFGLCIRFNRQVNINTFRQEVLDHIGAAEFLNTELGLLQMKLIRNDYEPDELPLFTYDNGILRVQGDDSTSSDSAVNYLTVNYRDPVTNKVADVTYQNLASIQTHGVIAETRDYLGLPTFELAARVAQRDLAMTASGLKRLIIRFNRIGGQLTPASCFRISLPDRDINNMIMRVGKIQEDARTGEFIITAVQDLFGLPATNYGVEQPPVEWVPPDRMPRPVTLAKVIEIPYFVLVGLLTEPELEYLQEEDGYAGIVASAPNMLSINYDLQVRAGVSEFSNQGTKDWTHKAALTHFIGLHDTQFVITGEAPRELPAAVLVNDEIMNILSIDIETGLTTVARGCADTIPGEHNDNSALWYIDTIENDEQVYAAGETVDARLLTNTGIGQLAENMATTFSGEMNQRQFRPYPPGNILINGETWTSEAPDASKGLLITWAHRDRLLQSDSLFGHKHGDIGPEPGTTYRITLYKENQIVREINIDGNNWMYPDENALYDEFDALTLYSVRDDITSFYGYTINVFFPEKTIDFTFGDDGHSPVDVDNIEFIFE